MTLGDIPVPDPVPTTAPAGSCDVIMKGGITSGVLYPWAVAEFARSYRLRGLGGASAGAIGAAIGAAAEFGRRRVASRSSWVSNRVQDPVVCEKLGMVGTRLRLLQGFALEMDHVPVELPRGMQRLIALLALRGPTHRCVVAGTLWPDVPEPQALASLRTGSGG